MSETAFIAGQAMIAAGVVLQVINATRLMRFLSRQELGVLGNRRVERLMAAAVPTLVMFFIPVYVYIFFVQIHNIWVGALLFAGAIFVTLVLQWIFMLVDNLKTRTLGIARALVGVFEAHDLELNGHSRHVQNLSLLLYDALPAHARAGVNRSDLSYAALFHDIGKLGVSDSVLHKPDKLSHEEMELMRDHPRIGAQILEPIESFGNTCEWIFKHHERIDGKGYYGFPAEEIPTGARIISVCDVFSAVTMRRAYKGSASYEDGIEVLREAAGTQLDSELVEAFCNLPREDVLACAPETIEVGDRG